MLVAKGGFHQVNQFDPEMKHVHRLSGYQPR